MRKSFPKTTIFFFSIEAMFLLNPFIPEHFENLAFKRNKKCNFKRLYLKTSDELRVKTNIFKKFIQFSLKEGVFLDALLTWVHNRGIDHLQLPVLMPVACFPFFENDQELSKNYQFFLLH